MIQGWPKDANHRTPPWLYILDGGFAEQIIAGVHVALSGDTISNRPRLQSMVKIGKREFHAGSPSLYCVRTEGDVYSQNRKKQSDAASMHRAST